LDERLDPDAKSECGSRSRRPKIGRKNASKRQIIRHKKEKSNVIGITWVNVTLFSLKVNF
jgi:hypothetical protein